VLPVLVGASSLNADDGVLQGPPAGRSLDPRIDPAKVGARSLPALPRDVLLPLPPDHRVAVAPHQVPIDTAHWDAAREAITAGITALRRLQHETGGWLVGIDAEPTDAPEKSSPVVVAVTALAIKAVVQADPPPGQTPDLRLAMRVITAARAADGSYDSGPLANYVTSAVVSALAAVDHPELEAGLVASAAWLQESQWDQSEGLDPRQDWFGGAGYGKHGRPDLSNTQMMLEALYDAGLSPDEPAFQRALAFLSRGQNLQAVNDADWASDDGGFVYTPAGGGESMASEAAGEGRRGELVPAGAPRSLRSYGSMTYAGFKSLLYAGLSPDDVRVRAAFDWIRRHWTFDENPGLGGQGLYYYYHAMSRALRVAQQPVITDTTGTAHNWREELIDAVVARQRPDGTWKNPADRWLEGEPEMATVFALLALEEALKPVTGAGAGHDGSGEPVTPPGGDGDGPV
jgi:squalene-hopene/tetraprenyl-beta-curcumene cyclase